MQRDVQAIHHDKKHRKYKGIKKHNLSRENQGDDLETYDVSTHSDLAQLLISIVFQYIHREKTLSIYE